MPTEVRAYKCDWCPRCFGRMNNAKAHEAACNNSPERRHCKTCVHGVLAVIERHEDIFGNKVIDDFGPFCDCHNKPIREWPYYIECEYYDNDHGPAEPMPGTCLAYEYKGYAGWTKQKTAPVQTARPTGKTSNESIPTNQTTVNEQKLHRRHA